MRQPKNECNCKNCTCNNADTDIREDVIGLAVDIIRLDDEKDDIIAWANTCVDNYNAALDDVDANFSTLSEKIENVDDAGITLFRFLCIWNIVLSVLFALSIYNVL